MTLRYDYESRNFGSPVAFAGKAPWEIDDKWLPKYYAEDRPAKLVDQLAWLKDIGFIGVDVIWKHYNFAIYGGTKP